MTQDEAMEKLQPVIYLAKLKTGLSFFLDQVFDFMSKNPESRLPTKIIQKVEIIVKYAK